MKLNIIKFQDDFYDLLQKHGIKNVNSEHEKFDEILRLRNLTANFIETVEEKYPPIKCPTEWGIDDVHAEREQQNMSKWSDDQAYGFLESIHSRLGEWCVENGWDMITNVLWEEEDGFERDMFHGRNE